MKENKKNKFYTGIVGFIIFAYAVGFGMLTSVTLLSGFFSFPEVIIGIIGVIICYYIAVIVHEGGHLVFGLLSGYRFSSFRIGSMMWINQDGRINLRRFTLAGTAGQCLMRPPVEVEKKSQIIVYNLGGVIANFIFSALLALLYYLFLNQVLLALILLLGAAVSFFMVISNGIPFNAGGIANDGMNALHLSKNPDAAEAFRKQLLMNAAQTEGVRISDMPDEWFAIPEGADMQNVHCASLAVFATSRHLDRGDTVTAEQEISVLLNSGYNIIGLHRQLLTCDLIYCRLVNDSAADVSSLITPELKKIMKSMRTYPAVIRTQYTLALLSEGNKEKAEQILSSYDKLTAKFPYRQDVDSDRALMLKAFEISKNR